MHSLKIIHIQNKPLSPSPTLPPPPRLPLTTWLIQSWRPCSRVCRPTGVAQRGTLCSQGRGPGPGPQSPNPQSPVRFEGQQRAPHIAAGQVQLSRGIIEGEGGDERVIKATPFRVASSSSPHQEKRSITPSAISSAHNPALKQHPLSLGTGQQEQPSRGYHSISHPCTRRCRLHRQQGNKRTQG